MPTFSLNQLLNKVFVAKKATGIYKSIYDKKPYKIIPAGQNIGTLYSWVTNKKTKEMFFMFYDSNKKPYYVKYLKGEGVIDQKALVSQGTKSNEDIIKEQTNKDLFDKSKVEYFIKKYGLYVLGFGLAAVALKASLNQHKQYGY